MIWNSSQRIKEKDHLVSSTSAELIIFRFKFQIKKRNNSSKILSILLSNYYYVCLEMYPYI